MTDVRAHLQALVDALPPGSVVSCPRDWLAELLAPAGPLATPSAKPEAEAPDRMLTVAEVAARLTVDTDWVYRHWKQLGCGVKYGRKVLRFTESGLNRYLERRKRAAA